MTDTESIYLDSLLDNIKKLSDSEINEFLDALTDDEKISFEEKVEIIKGHIYNKNIISNNATSIIIDDATIEANTNRALIISKEISSDMNNLISKLILFFKNNDTDKATDEVNCGNLYNFIMGYTNKKIIQLPIDAFTKYHTWNASKATKYEEGQQYYLLKEDGAENNITDFVNYPHPENDFSSYYIKTKGIIYNKVSSGKYNKLNDYYKLNSYNDYEKVLENIESNFTNYYNLSYKKATSYNNNVKYFKILNDKYIEIPDVTAENFTDYYIKKSNDKFEKVTTYNVNESYYIYITNIRISSS